MASGPAIPLGTAKPAAEDRPARRVDRLVNKRDFERLLAGRSCGRSAHFAVHHVNGSPELASGAWNRPAERELCTGAAPSTVPPVDNVVDGLWVGCVIPKRHARRSATRSLLKRQVRGAFQRHGDQLPSGLWLVRLRAPFAVDRFPSAQSDALAAAARGELDTLLAGLRRGAATPPMNKSPA